MDLKEYSKLLSAMLSIDIHIQENELVYHYFNGIEETKFGLEADKEIKKDLDKIIQSNIPYILKIRKNTYMAVTKIEDNQYTIGPFILPDILYSNYHYNRFELPNRPIPTLSTRQIIASLDFALQMFSKKQISESELFAHNFLNREELSLNAIKTDVDILNNISEGKFHKSFDQVSRLEKVVMNGEINSVFEAYHENIKIYEDDIDNNKYDLRFSKDMAISGLAIITRAAIKGGVLYELAYSLSDTYITKIEECIENSQLNKVYYQILLQFTNLVNDFNNGKVEKYENYYTERAIKYITKNVNIPITVQEIAKELKITPNYLSAIFKKNEGITITEYITNHKITLAKKMMNYSTYSISAIASSLGYSSQSHFGKVFKEVTGLTPKQYMNNKTIDDNNEFKMIK